MRGVQWRCESGEVMQSVRPSPSFLGAGGFIFCGLQIVQVNCGCKMRAGLLCRAVGRPGNAADVNQRWIDVLHMTVW